jgi:Entner-Doudoroff aldolase
MTPADFVARLGRERCSAILRTPIASAAAPAMEAAVRGGFRIVEFTLTIPEAFDRITEFSKRDLVVGAGTVLTVDDARKAVESGAQFLVSPVVDEAVIRAAADLGVAMLPGAFTPTEMLRAHRAGAPLVKLFPAPHDPPAWLRQVLGPLPFLKIVPTAGVDESNAKAQLSAGAFAVGFVSSLFPAELLAKGDWTGIEERARRLRAAIA